MTRDTKYFVKNDDGIHLVGVLAGANEYTLCGDAFDDDRPGSVWSQSIIRKVSCLRCVRIIALCRGVRVL